MDEAVDSALASDNEAAISPGSESQANEGDAKGDEVLDGADAEAAVASEAESGKDEGESKTNGDKSDDPEDALKKKLLESSDDDGEDGEGVSTKTTFEGFSKNETEKCKVGSTKKSSQSEN